MNAVSDDVIADVNMLGARVVCVVFRESDRRLVVAMEGDRVVGEVESFADESLQPDGLFGGVCCRDVFGFGSRESDDFLLSGKPRDSSAINKKGVARDGMAVFLRRAVCVCVTCNRVFCFSEDELEVLGAEEVSVNVLDAVPVDFARIFLEIGREERQRRKYPVV